MARNKANLQKAKVLKEDEFYTRLEDIKNELNNYGRHFKGKTIYCNCDDPFESYFFKFFVENFNRFEIKKLITTSYFNSPVAGKTLPLQDILGLKGKEGAFRIEITEVPDLNGDGETDIHDVKMLLKQDANAVRPLQYDGSYNSPECLEFLEEADIVVTNPPFSLWRDFFATLMDYDKKFIILGSKNAVSYKEVFPYIQKNKVWLGTTSDLSFIVPGSTKLKPVPSYWFTNLDHGKRHEKINLDCKYNKKDYLKYDNFDAIEVGQTKCIPKGYKGKMGVPISYLNRHNPDQFEIVGILNDTERDFEIGATKTPSYKGGKLVISKGPVVNKVKKYARVIIKHRNPDESTDCHYTKHKKKLYGEQEGICNGCHLPIPYKLMEVDHINSDLKGTPEGEKIENLQLLCGHCNKSKQKKSMSEWEAWKKKKWEERNS